MRTSRRGAVDPFIVMDVMEAARAAEAAGRDIVHMEVGQPGTGAPAAALAALGAQMSQAPLGYTVALGLPQLRARIARHYGDWHGVDLDPGRVVVTAGASGAFLLAFSALFDAGDKVGLGLPCYPSYRQILKAMSLEPVHLRTRLEAGMQPEPGDVAGRGLAGLILASPANPTGAMLSAGRLEALAGACAAEGISLISDEIYHGIGARPVSALQITDEVVVINSFSKYFSMTGWRIGWMVVPPALVRTFERLAQNLFICPPHASQIVALHAMECAPELEANAAVYAANREAMLAALPAMGLTRFAPPDGAFYVYADVSGVTDDSLALSREILDKVGVSVTPGVDFDPEEGHLWMRISYAGPEAAIAEGLRRLHGFFTGRARREGVA